VNRRLAAAAEDLDSSGGDVAAGQPGAGQHIPEELKWRRNVRQAALDKYLRLTDSHAE